MIFRDVKKIPGINFHSASNCLRCRTPRQAPAAPAASMGPPTAQEPWVLFGTAGTAGTAGAAGMVVISYPEPDAKNTR